MKFSLDPTSCPICGIMVLLGEAEAHFFKELEKLTHLTTINRDKKYAIEKYRDVQSCFPTFGNSSSSSSSDDNGSLTDSGVPRGRWEVRQKIYYNDMKIIYIHT